jgi:hypothetical protein
MMSIGYWSRWNQDNIEEDEFVYCTDFNIMLGSFNREFPIILLIITIIRDTVA